MENKREIWIDWLRVAACLMVFIVHSTEPFYLGGDESLILNATDAFWASFFDSFVRSCVPLFVIASSYLLFPLKCSTGEFLRKRAIRILIPFVLWSVVYAFVWGEPVENFRYLMHLLILVPVCGWFRECLGSGVEGVLGFWTTPVEILGAAIVAFIVTAVVSVLIRKIPVIGKYIV